jgi:hypothetical protein
MTFGLRCSRPARRPHPASLPVRVPAVEGLLRASFSFTSRLRLAFRYGCRHRLRLAPFIQLDSAHAGHTSAAGLRPGSGLAKNPQKPRLNGAVDDSRAERKIPEVVKSSISETFSTVAVSLVHGICTDAARLFSGRRRLATTISPKNELEWVLGPHPCG